MNVQNVSEAIVAIVVAIIGVVTPYLAKFIKSNKTAQTLVDILPTLAKDAVVAMQKLGVTTYIEGEVKKSKAGKIVEAALKNLGFTEIDETTTANAIESAFASLTADGTLATYTQATPETAAETEAEKKATELKQAQADLTAAQAKVNSLTQAQ